MPTGTTRGKKDGWGQAGTLSTGGIQQVTMQADFDEPGTYTAEFAIGGAQQQYSVNTYINEQGKQQTSIGGGGASSGISPNPIYAVATVTWGVEGQYVSRQVSVGNGVSISGVGQSVKIVITDATPAIYGPNNNTLYGVQVQVSKGVRGTSKQPPVLLPSQGIISGPGGSTQQGVSSYHLVAGGQVVLPIPQSGGVISVYTTVFATTPIVEGLVSVILQNQAAGTLMEWDPRDFPDWVPVTPGATDIELLNNAAVDTNWAVFFGVDG